MKYKIEVTKVFEVEAETEAQAVADLENFFVLHFARPKNVVEPADKNVRVIRS